MWSSGALIDVYRGSVDDDVQDQAREGLRLIESVKTDLLHMRKQAGCFDQHPASQDCRALVSEPTADQVDPPELLYPNGPPVTSDVSGTATLGQATMA